MALQISCQELDEFCSRLFRLLDNLGLLPRQLWAKPNEFEKYPRLLLGNIQRYNDVEAGFKEWEGRILRDSQYRKEESYLEIESLRQWMSQHANLFTNASNMNHLRTSLYARVFQYLYPRRILVNAYCTKHQGNTAAIEIEFVKREFPNSIESNIEAIHKIYQDEWNAIVEDAQAALLASTGYYRKVLAGRDTISSIEGETVEAIAENNEEFEEAKP